MKITLGEFIHLIKSRERERELTRVQRQLLKWAESVGGWVREALNFVCKTQICDSAAALLHETIIDTRGESHCHPSTPPILKSGKMYTKIKYSITYLKALTRPSWHSLAVSYEIKESDNVTLMGLPPIYKKKNITFTTQFPFIFIYFS